MYTALVMVVLMQGPVALRDERGPYATEPECRARVVEMQAAIAKMVPGVREMRGKCAAEKDDGQPV